MNSFSNIHTEKGRKKHLPYPTSQTTESSLAINEVAHLPGQWHSSMKKSFKPGVVAHACNPNTPVISTLWEAKVGRPLEVRSLRQA